MKPSRLRAAGLLGGLGALTALAAVLVAACANGSSLGIPDPGVADAEMTTDPGGPISVRQPVTTIRRDSGLGTLPVGQGAEAGAAQTTMSITVDSGAGGGTDGGSGDDDGTDPSCAAVGPSFVCGLAPQCGCGANATCDVSDETTGATACTPAGATIQGDQCFETSDCLAGLTCFLGACRPYCTGTTIGADCLGAGLGTCAQATSEGTAIPNEEVCFVSCDLSNPSAACGANGCVHEGTESNCESVGFSTDGESCSDPTDCAPGYACVTSSADDAATSSTCLAYCQFAPDTCTGGETCRHFSTDVVLDGNTYGFCQ